MLLPLSNSPEVALVDDDFVVKGTYRINRSGYAINSEGKLIHRLVMGETDPKVVIDHINRNRLDNRKCNLRRASPQQNSLNKKPSKKNKLGFKNVHFDSRRDTVRIRLGINKKMVHCAIFPLEYLDFAISIADLIIARTHQEFAAPNRKLLKDLDKHHPALSKRMYMVNLNGQLMSTYNLSEFAKTWGLDYRKLKYSYENPGKGVYHKMGVTVTLATELITVREFLNEIDRKYNYVNYQSL